GLRRPVVGHGDGGWAHVPAAHGPERQALVHPARARDLDRGDADRRAGAGDAEIARTRRPRRVPWIFEGIPPNDPNNPRNDMNMSPNDMSMSWNDIKRSFGGIRAKERVRPAVRSSRPRATPSTTRPGS